MLAQSRIGSVHDWIQHREDALKSAKDAIVAAQARQAIYADRGSVTSNLNVGDSVPVYKDFLITAEARDHPSHKLRPKWFGPFTAIEMVGPNAYKLYLPSTIRCHPVSNVTALRKHEMNIIPERRQPPPPPVTDLQCNTRYSVHGGEYLGRSYTMT